VTNQFLWQQMLPLYNTQKKTVGKKQRSSTTLEAPTSEKAYETKDKHNNKLANSGARLAVPRHWPDTPTGLRTP